MARKPGRKSRAAYILRGWEDPVEAKARWYKRLEANPEMAWEEFAVHLAEKAHNYESSTRWGHSLLNELPSASGQVIWVFNKNLPQLENRRRDEEVERFRRQMREAGIQELAYGTYPLPGMKDAGYTYVMILDADEAQSFLVDNTINQANHEAGEWFDNSSQEEAEECAAAGLKPTPIYFDSDPSGDSADDEKGEVVDETVATDAAIAREKCQLRLPEEVPSGSAYSEGSVQRILVNRYERDPRAREECIQHFGTTCFLCGFDFVAVYGEVMVGFTHVHHLNPLSSVGAEYEVDPIQDLRPVCPNCHSVIHRRDPPYSLEEVRKLLEATKGNRGELLK